MDRKSFLDEVYKYYLKDDNYIKLSKSFPLIGVASKLNIAVAGSLGFHISREKGFKVPSDIDFVTDDNDKALRFVLHTIMLFEKYNWYGSVLIQNKTKFCFNGTMQHYKITSSFGVNVCVLVLKDKLNFWYNKCGICIQKFDDIISYMKIASDKDKKVRIELTEGL